MTNIYVYNKNGNTKILKTEGPQAQELADWGLDTVEQLGLGLPPDGLWVFEGNFWWVDVAENWAEYQECEGKYRKPTFEEGISLFGMGQEEALAALRDHLDILKEMSPEERFQWMVKTGLINEDGTLKWKDTEMAKPPNTKKPKEMVVEEETPVLLRFARYYATQKHHNQAYSGGLPYTHHLAKVEAVLVEYGFTEIEMRAAAWLHDVVEDTETKIKDISELFGKEVANLVGAVTNEPGPNRKTRAALTYPKIRQSDKAIALKLADRIANISQEGSLVEMYRKEYPEFRHGLFIPTKDQRILDMWKALDKWAEKV